jgi:hypothetical protein
VEHVIPQAIGGRLKARLYCKVCNEDFGDGLDDGEKMGDVGSNTT